MEKELITSVIETLERGGTLLYPTDTIWGIGCDATCFSAVERLYAIKKRDHSKSMLVLCADMAMVEQYVSHIGDRERQLLDAERATTVVLPMEIKRLACSLPAADGTIGVRIPRMAFCHELLTAFGRPIVSTSANFSGQPSPKCFSDIDTELVQRVDFCVPSGYEEERCERGSRIVKLLPDGGIQILRE